MKIYIVTSGDYDTYQIGAVFLNKENADKYAKYQNEEDEKIYKDLHLKEYGFKVEEYEAIDR